MRLLLSKLRNRPRSAADKIIVSALAASLSLAVVIGVSAYGAGDPASAADSRGSQNRAAQHPAGQRTSGDRPAGERPAPITQPTSAPADPAASSTVNTAGFPTGGNNPGIFTNTCERTNTASIDPIMMPGMTGMTMQHDFFGNRTVTASTVAKDLVGGSTSCSTSADSSSYWTPVLSRNGVQLKPKDVLIYWQARPESAAKIQTMPAGISIVAGNAKATVAQSSDVIEWTCSNAPGAPMAARATIPKDCATGTSLRLIVKFPSCWDGQTLDGKIRTGVVYPAAGGICPTSNPVLIPQIVMHINYPTSLTDGLTLSTAPTEEGSTLTAHADFINGWNQSRMDANVAACINTQTRCGNTVGALATPQGGRVPPAGTAPSPRPGNRPASPGATPSPRPTA